MRLQLRRGIVLAIAAGTVSAAVLGAGAGASVASAGAVPRVAPGCSWPVSSGQVASTLGIKITKATNAGVGYTGRLGNFALCIYGSQDGATALYYYSGVTTRQFFLNLETGIARAKNLRHITTVSGLGSEAFYATSGRQTFLFVHAGSTAVFLFADRPPADLVRLAHLIVAKLPSLGTGTGGSPPASGSGGTSYGGVTMGTKLPASFPKSVPLPAGSKLVAQVSSSSKFYELWFVVTGSQANVVNAYKGTLGRAGFAVTSSGGMAGSAITLGAKSSSWAVEATVFATGTAAAIPRSDVKAGQVEMELIVG